MNNKTSPLTLFVILCIALITLSGAEAQTPPADVQQEMIQYVNDNYGHSLPCLSNMQVTENNNVAMITFPKLSCVTDDAGVVMTSSLVGGTVTLFDYLPAPKGGYPKGVVQEDGSVNITFDVESTGACVRIIDPTFKKGKTRGWVGPSNDPLDQFRQMHGGHVVTAVGFYNGQPVVLTPPVKTALCLATPGVESDDQNNPSVCDQKNQPQAVSD